MKNVLIGQSGGPTGVINGSLYGVIKGFKDENTTIYGMINGVEGFLEGRYTNLSELTDEELARLKITPAMYLGSCRYKLPNDLNHEIYEILHKKFQELNIGHIFYIGGNDSMDTCHKISEYLKLKDSGITVIGIPKTIDNDLNNVDHTPGYPSSAKYIINEVLNISMDASIYYDKSITIVEIMGRDTGWLTYSSILARKYENDNPLLIYLPERSIPKDKLIKDIENAFKIKNNVVICVSEGIWDENGVLYCEYDKTVKEDTFGHKNLSGCSKTLEVLLKEQFGCKTRGIELNVSQRCANFLLSSVDLGEAINYGVYASKFAKEGLTGVVVSSERVSNEPYELKFIHKNIADCALKVKQVPDEFIEDESKFIEYLKPLIGDDVELPKKNGLPNYLYRKGF